MWSGLIEAKALAQRGEHAAAQDLAGRSLVAAQELQAPIGLGMLLVMHAEVLHLDGRAQSSAEALARGVDLLERKGASALAAQARQDAAGWPGP